MIIVVENRYDDQRSRLFAYSHNANTLGKGMNQDYSPSSYR